MAKHLSPSRVASAARNLAGAALPTFADFLILKLHGIEAGARKRTRVPDLEGPVEELMGVRDASGRPVVLNRPNLSVLKTRKNWVHSGYARSGTYTNLDRGSLGKIVDFPEAISAEDGRHLKLKPAYLQLAQRHILKNGPIPLVELAIWACRKDEFEDRATLHDVVELFISRYKLSPIERSSFFREPSAAVGESGLFAPGPFDADALAVAILEVFPPSEDINEADDEPEEAVAESVYSIDDNDEHLALVRSLLFDDLFGGVIFVGFPGTGKTWYARQIALRLANGDTGRVREIQFHPSYQYEDFVEGYAPTGPGNYEIIGKHLVQMCAIADQTDEPVFLVIDEFSRSDPVRVMGEALTYMDGAARGKRFYLASGRSLSIPTNLYFLATMNPQDRSVDEMDSAMERRWAKIQLEPEPKLVNSFLSDNGLGREFRGPIVQFFQDLQEFASVGHAYFRMVRDLASLKRLWNHQLLHVLHKQHRYNPEVVERANGRFEALVTRISSPTDVNNSEGEEPSTSSAPEESADAAPNA